jgi:hypothetical protein
MSEVAPDAVRQKVQPPALCLLGLGVGGVLWGLFQGCGVAAAFGLIVEAEGLPPPDAAVWAYPLFGGGSLLGLVAAAMYAMVLVGAMRMKNLRSYGLSISAAVLAIVTCCSLCAVVGLPVGIWALVVLRSPEVKAAFS